MFHDQRQMEAHPQELLEFSFRSSQHQTQNDQ